MNFPDLLRALRNGDIAEVNSDDAMAVYHLVVGYGTANAATQPLLKAFESCFEGPGAAEGFTRAYLGGVPMDAVFDTLLALVGTHSEDVLRPIATAFTERGFPTIIVDAISQRRPALFLFEPTVLCLSSVWRGFILGATAVDAVLGERQRLEEAAYDAWIRQYYGYPHAHWSRLLRILEGPSESGLEAFARHWAEFSKQ